MIASDLDALNASFEGLRGKVRKLVPCLCTQCLQSTTPERYEEGRLLKRKHDGKLMVECPESYEEVSVLQLLDGYNFDPRPARLKPEDNMPAAPEGFPPGFAPHFGSPALKTIRIFLASSCELKEDRDAFELYFLRFNEQLIQQGIRLTILRWENFLDAMSETHMQDTYNHEVRSCDIFVSLFKTKTGRYTEAEFDAAHEAFLSTKKPLIYTYFKEALIGTSSIGDEITTLLNFKKKLKRLRHYHTEYENIQDLQLKFREQLTLLLQSNRI